ncbi:DUF4249 family protein [Maribacter algicola]|uniref:DUF4249 family protein n=1 Tax=Meishania litoralis TaxID=3434685 RepID=A0ACC7LLY4_9FLAO
MKKLTLALAIFLALSGCQDVIEVDVPVDSPRLVIDAVLRMDNIDQPNTVVQIRASVTSSFFDEINPAVLNSISITNLESNTVVNLTEQTPGSGIYRADIPTNRLVEGTSRLSINYRDELYEAEAIFVPSAPIDELRQGTSTLFTGEETEIVLTFTDAPDRVDFYLFDFDFNEYLVSEDTFYPGQPFQFSYFYDSELAPQTILDISILGVDEQFYNYMNQIILQSGGEQGPFQTPAATVKGNIVNITNPDNFALGYFAISQAFTASLEVAEN